MSKEKFDWSEFLREAGVYAVRLAFIAFVVAMALAVYLLGERFDQPQPMRLLVAAGCAIGIFGHGVAATATKNGTNAGRMMHGIALGTWLLLSLFLASLYALISSKDLAAFVPDGMAQIGALVYALCFGIGLFTSTLALVVPAVAARPIHDSAMPTLGSAVARFGEPLFIILCIGASSLHLFTFGLEVAKVGMFSTVAAMVIADLSFIVAEKRVLHEVKARHAAQRYDRFDLIAWGIFGLMVLVYLVLVNVYSVRHSAGTLNADDALLAKVIDFYGASPTLLILSMASLALITAFVDVKAGGDVEEERPVLSRLAGNVKVQRQALRELKQAWNEPAGVLRQAQDVAPQLPSATMADEGVTLKAQSRKHGADWWIENAAGERINGGTAKGLGDAQHDAIAAYEAMQHKSDVPKRSENGTPYDTTGEEVRGDWPTDEERRRVLDELARRMGGAEAKK